MENGDELIYFKACLSQCEKRGLCDGNGTVIRFLAQHLAPSVTGTGNAIWGSFELGMLNRSVINLPATLFAFNIGVRGEGAVLGDRMERLSFS